MSRLLSPRTEAGGRTATGPAREGRRGEAFATSGRADVLVERPYGPLGFLAGWLVAWGAAALGAASLSSAGVDLGLGLGLTEGPGADGFWAGLWLAVVQAGAFLAGGYVAARVARRYGLLHAVGAWVLAMLATFADAIAAAVRDGDPGVLGRLGIPHWADTGLADTGWAILALGLFAVASLVGALIGGAIGAGVNRGQDALVRRRAERAA